MDKEKSAVLLVLKEKMEKCSAGFYFDCTRDDLYNMVYNICSNTLETRNYSKFADSIANVMFKKVYVEGEAWHPKLILGLTDIAIDTLQMQSEDVGFNPANAMIGDERLNADSIKSRIIEQFNKNVRDFNDEEMMEYLIEV